MDTLDYIYAKLDWMRRNRIWPNGLRYLWTDAFGLILQVSLYARTDDRKHLDAAEALVREVNRVLGCPRGLRIGEAPDRDGQYFHYLAMWLYALAVLGRYRAEYRQQGVDIARNVHAAFVDPGRGVFWKMTEDLTRPYPGYGYGALDAFDGYLAYQLLDPHALAAEIDAMRQLIRQTASRLWVTQDLGIGMMLWMSHFFPDEEWAMEQRSRCLQTLDSMWEDAGYFCREPDHRQLHFAFTNYGLSIGLQAVGAMPERVAQLHRYFDAYRSGDHYDYDAITHVMACSAHFPGFLLRDFRPGIRRGEGGDPGQAE